MGDLIARISRWIASRLRYGPPWERHADTSVWNRSGRTHSAEFTELAQLTRSYLRMREEQR